MEITNIIKRRINEYHVEKYGREPSGKQMDMAVSNVLTAIVDNTINIRNWTQFIPLKKDIFNE